MRKFKQLAILLMLLMVGACTSNHTDMPVITALQVEVKAPLGIEGEMSELKGSIKGLNGEEKVLDFVSGIAKCELLEGSYTIELTAQFRFTDEHQMIRDEALHLVDNIELKGETKVDRVLQFSSFQTNGTFLIEEIFFSGTSTKEGSDYDNDKYIRITNNSAQTLYADGLTLLVSHFSVSEKKHNLQPNIIQEKFPVKMAFQIKGNGTEYPVKAGESIILCQSAIDHREFNPQSFSLTSANFEWLSEKATIDGEFPSNPEVPNMSLIYSDDGNGVWSMNSNGDETFAIAILPNDFIEHISDAHIYEYTEEIIMDGVSYGVVPGGPALAVPNELLLDAVNLCPKNSHEWLPISPSMDSGFAYVAEDFNSPERYSLSVLRKSNTQNGVRTLIDTNDSSSDFEISKPATLLK